MLTRQTTLNFEQYQKLTNEEKAVFVEIKAVYNAKKEARKWNLYLPLSSATFFISNFDRMGDSTKDHGVLAYLGLPVWVFPIIYSSWIETILKV